MLTPGTNCTITVLGAIEVTTGAWVYRLGRYCAADFIALLDQLLRAFPRAPVIAVICDNDSIHHARKVTAYLEKRVGRDSPHDNPAERIWGALKNYVANTGELGRTAAADPLFLSQPLTGSDDRYRRTLDQPLAAPGCRTASIGSRMCRRYGLIKALPSAS